MTDNYTCPDCSGEFPHPVKWTGDWVCPWCYNRFMKHHSAVPFAYEKAGKDFPEFD